MGFADGVGSLGAFFVSTFFAGRGADEEEEEDEEEDEEDEEDDEEDEGPPAPAAVLPFVPEPLPIPFLGGIYSSPYKNILLILS